MTMLEPKVVRQKLCMGTTVMLAVEAPNVEAQRGDQLRWQSKPLTWIENSVDRL